MRSINILIAILIVAGSPSVAWSFGGGQLSESTQQKSNQGSMLKSKLTLLANKGSLAKRYVDHLVNEYDILNVQMPVSGISEDSNGDLIIPARVLLEIFSSDSHKIEIGSKGLYDYLGSEVTMRFIDGASISFWFPSYKEKSNLEIYYKSKIEYTRQVPDLHLVDSNAVAYDEYTGNMYNTRVIKRNYSVCEYKATIRDFLSPQDTLEFKLVRSDSKGNLTFSER